MLLVGTGIGSKVALGALSAFFPVTINVAAAVRQVNPVLIRVGRSFRLSPWQMATRIYLPALRPALVTSLRLGFGLAVVGVLLAEIKLSNAGLGFLANEYYSHFKVPELYGVLLLIFIVAVGANSAMSYWDRTRLPRRCGSASSSALGPRWIDAAAVQHQRALASPRSASLACCSTRITVSESSRDQPLQRLQQRLDDDRREALERLVQQQQRRVAHQRAADGEHLLLAAGDLVAACGCAAPPGAGTGRRPAPASSGPGARRR